MTPFEIKRNWLLKRFGKFGKDDEYESVSSLDFRQAEITDPGRFWADIHQAWAVGKTADSSGRKSHGETASTSARYIHINFRPQQKYRPGLKEEDNQDQSFRNGGNKPQFQFLKHWL